MSHGTSTNSKILSDLGKCLLEAARFGNTEEVRNLMSNGAPLITDWVSFFVIVYHLYGFDLNLLWINETLYIVYMLRLLIRISK